MGEAAQKTAVLLHGLSEERSVWERQASTLRGLMNVVAIDVRGFGKSPVGAGNGTVGQMADDLAQVLSAYGGGPAWLIGFSMGGVIAQRFALDFPAMTDGLVLIASSGKVGRAGQAFFHQRLDEVAAGGLETLATINRGDARGCFTIGDEAMVEEYRQLRTGAVRDVNGYLNAGRAMLRLADEPIVDEIGAIACPTLVVAGENDPYCPPRASEMIASAIPGAVLTVVPEAGHCLHWEKPDLTNDLIRDFIFGKGYGT